MVNLFSFFSSTPSNGESRIESKDLEEARIRIREAFEPSPLTFSPGLSELIGHQIYLKWDSKLRTGSFKERGSVNLLLSLSDKQRTRGVCAASLGNHALALSYHSQRLNIPCLIVMPSAAPLVKIQSTRNTGAEVVLHGQYFDEAYEFAIALSKERGMLFVPAFDDPLIIAGQGTAGLEMIDQLSDFDSVVVPIGGGGLIAGIASAIKIHKPNVFILGARSDWALEHRAEKEGPTRPLIPPSTIADGIAVKRPGKITAPIIDRLVDKTVSVSESSLANALVRFLEIERSVAEGAGIAGFAALLEKQLPPECKRTIIEISGSNIDMNLLSRLIERDMGERGRLLRVIVSTPDRPGSLHTITGIISRTGANVLQVQHDRSFSELPGNVEVTFMLEVKDVQHKFSVLKALSDLGIYAREICKPVTT